MSADTIAHTAFKQGTKPLYDYDKHWASCYEPAPYLPMSRAEMDALGWDACDVIIVSGDAYVDHPSFGMAIIGHLLESQDMGRSDLIGKNRGCLIPPHNTYLEGRDAEQDSYQSARKKNSRIGNDSAKRQNRSKNSTNKAQANNRSKKRVSKGNFQTQHTGLPPRKTK